jgi:hypothetical protein
MSPANGEQRQDCGLFGPDTALVLGAEVRAMRDSARALAA